MQKSSDNDEGGIVTSTFDLDMSEKEKVIKKPEAPVKKAAPAEPKEEVIPDVDIFALANKISNVGLVAIPD